MRGVAVIRDTNDLISRTWDWLLSARFDLGLIVNDRPAWSWGPYLKRVATAMGLDFLNVRFDENGFQWPSAHRYDFKLSIDYSDPVPGIPQVFGGVLDYTWRNSRQTFQVTALPVVCYVPN